jgi:hypothetical protein
MDGDQRQSIHEIGLARRLIISPARAEMVTLGPPSQEGNNSPLEPIQEEVDQEVDHAADDAADRSMERFDEVEGKSIF